MKSLENKTALVTGGSRGIGRAIALAMAEEGANIAVVFAGNREAAEKTAAEIAEKGVQARIYQCDVASAGETEAVVKQILDDFGGVDILVNNAGIVRDTLLLRMKEEDFDERNLILALDETDKLKIFENYENAVNVYLLSAFVGSTEEIQNPLGGTLQDYGACYELIESLIAKLVIKLNEEELLC